MSDEAMALALLLSTLERIAVAVEKLAVEAEKANKQSTAWRHPQNPNHYTCGGK